MKRHPILYSARELTWMKVHSQMPRKEAYAKFITTFGREDVSQVNFTALCKRNRWLTGRTGCFVPGQISPTKGKKMPFNANSAKTQFKKGQLPHNTKFLGHESLTKDGYIQISVDQTNPHTGADRRYVHKHRHLWELKNGPVPEGMVLKCLDGDKSNTDPSNWEAIPLAMLPRLNGRFGRDYDAADSEIKPTIMAITKLEHMARSAKQKGTRS